jgi:hypothetical protein
MFAAGFLWMAAGSAHGWPLDAVAILVALNGVTAFVALFVPERSEAGRAAIRAVEERCPAALLEANDHIRTKGYGGASPRLAALGADPAAVAAIGPELAWAGAPHLAAALGSRPPRPSTGSSSPFGPFGPLGPGGGFGGGGSG